MGQELIFGKMDINMLENGKWINKMDLGNIFLIMELLKREFGKMGNESNENYNLIDTIYKFSNLNS